MDEPALSAPYIEAVLIELKSYFARPEIRDRKIETVFFGGGTPSLVNPEKIGSVIQCIRDFGDLDEDAEITLEANPGTVQEELGREKLTSLKTLGVNRISFGAQSFSERKLSLLGRLHQPADVEQAVLNSRHAGFKRLNLDLIFGTLEESLDEWREDLSCALKLAPEHLSVYGLTIEPGTDFGKLAKRGIRMDSTDSLQADLFCESQKTLGSASYRQYEVSNYALSGEECKHNRNYWRRGEYLGIGAGAHGFLKSGENFWGKRWRNTPRPEHYIEKVRQNGIGELFEEVLTEGDAELEFISLGFRTDEGISVTAYQRDFEGNFEERFGAGLRELVDEELVVREGETVRATKKGLLFLNSIVEKLFVVLLFISTSFADDQLPEVLVSDTVPRVALKESVTTIETLATPLNYEPYVDLQSRGSAEGQSDLVIRGSTFENSAVSLGALSLIDPQTGHFVLELPVSSKFFTSPEIITGNEQSIRGLNASVGSVGFDFLKITESETELRAGAGEWGTDVESILVRRANIAGKDGPDIGLDLDYSRSRSGGSVQNGDSRFDRVSGRLQLNTELGQTDLFGGFEHKFVSWPNLYVLQALHDVVGSSGIESDELHTGMVGLHHEAKLDEAGSVIKAGLLYRENRDDYEFDRYQINLFNPFEHNTKLLTGAVEGTLVCDYFRVRGSAHVMGDWINSTALTFLSYDSRVLSQMALVPELVLPLEDQLEFVASAGLRYDDSDKNPGQVLPITGVSLTHRTSEKDWEQAFINFSGASQVPGYTALASNPAGGLFRGNPDLNRTISLNSEIGGEVNRGPIKVRSSLFYRKDNDLTDWVFQSQVQPFASRTAANVDIATIGWETLARADFGQGSAIFSYVLMNKEHNYGDLDVDASFYALNFPDHRFTLSGTYDVTDWVHLRSDNELRIQEPNSLRDSDDRSYMISSAGIRFDIAMVTGMSVEALVDNIGNENFEEVPGVPGRRRAAMGYLNYRW